MVILVRAFTLEMLRPWRRFLKHTLAPRLKHHAVLTVDDTLTVPSVSDKLGAFDDMPPVFATAFMIGFIEATCIEAIAPHLDEGEHSVGTHVDVSHVAATPVGMKVKAEIELLEVDGRKLRFRVRAEDQDGLIGEGLHQRAVIDIAKFNARLTTKAERHV